ncbi:MAG TPA: hypothetical protein PKI54_13365 [Bacteroidia bacterium]|nr:hypothetical protein [Bacteroidia bacterium]
MKVKVYKCSVDSLEQRASDVWGSLQDAISKVDYSVTSNDVFYAAFNTFVGNVAALVGTSRAIVELQEPIENEIENKKKGR